MTKAELLQFMRENSLAVQASVTMSGSPQAAVIGIVVTDEFEIFFDTLDTSRKAANLKSNPRIALVIGGMSGGERTVQYEGEADRPNGNELEQLKEFYFLQFPDGRDRLSWPGLTYVRVRPSWIRYSDFSQIPPETIELNAEDLRRLP